MTLLSTAQHIARDTRKDPRSHIILIIFAATIAAGAIALVAYLLWPTWGARSADTPSRLPVSVGATLFNVPTSAIRRKIQRHSGQQERVDLSFLFPSHEAPKHVSADTVDEKVQPIDRIFVSIAAHRDTLAPDTRVRTIYPRYLEQTPTLVEDGLTMRAFRDGSPYANEDLFSARWADARHVPEREPHRRRRPDVSLSTELARAMARRCERNEPFDGADARVEGLVPARRGQGA